MIDKQRTEVIHLPAKMSNKISRAFKKDKKTSFLFYKVHYRIHLTILTFFVNKLKIFIQAFLLSLNNTRENKLNKRRIFVTDGNILDQG